LQLTYWAKDSTGSQQLATSWYWYTAAAGGYWERMRDLVLGKQPLTLTVTTMSGRYLNLSRSASPAIFQPMLPGIYRNWEQELQQAGTLWRLPRSRFG